MITVSDTSPINYLAQIGAIDILPNLFDILLIPEAVYRELLHEHAPRPVRDWAQNLPTTCQVVSVETLQPFPGLGDGESEAISLALSRQVSLLLIDERKGRLAAEAVGLRCAGTLRILELAAELELISLPESLKQLRATNFRISERTLQDMLARHLSRGQQEG